MRTEATAATRSVTLAALVAVLLRLPFTWRPSYPDEAGYLLVARHWHGGGPGLYGSLWVDRPPLLIAFWRAADALGGVVAGRGLAMVAVVVLVAAAGASGWSVGGVRGARWSAASAAVLAASPLLGAPEVDAEILAAPLVMVGVALTLRAVRPGAAGSRAAAYAVLAGVAAVSAVLVKQNFVDALAFPVALVVAAAARRDLAPRVAARVVVSGLLGALVPLLLVLWWVTTASAGTGTLLYTLYGFRVDASRAIDSHSLSAPDRRAWGLWGLVLVSGLLPLTAYVVGHVVVRIRRLDPVPVGIAAMLVVEVAGIVLGGSYWSHYLVALVPSVVLGVGWLAGRGKLRVTVLLVGAVAVACVVGMGNLLARPANNHVDAALVGYLASVDRPGDTGYVGYGHPNILLDSGLRPAYPYLWSLTLRVLDPDLELLTRRLSGPDAPTWYVQGTPENSWGIDDSGILTRTLAEHYRQVATVCDVPVYLVKGVSRPTGVSSDDC
ncbi:hypothetical protein H5V45_20725 [Nocardioides sp. KIGAM211]|uniref:Glycosyltransferase RgtA/B/C/D-like domain-containing protein n=1 Tax=Nocardioides luti TaxID=2761101 RepID=A0A7X0RK44_9ACTN|nr:hypothetical protein [Nocardioides luti]MBB6629754.1 hypothetical protein [Nocardioides luti]